MIEFIAGGLGAATFSFYAVTTDMLLVRIGAILFVAGDAYLMYYLRRHGQTQAVPSGDAPCLTYYRRQLVRQRDLLSTTWRWYLGPLLPGFVIFSIGIAVELGTSILWCATSIALLGLLAASIGITNQSAAKRIQDQLDALPPPDHETAE